MKSTTVRQIEHPVTVESCSNRRGKGRVGGKFGVMFSGVDNGQFVMGDGYVMDLSQGGAGIRTNRLIKAGMHLALFIELPDSDDHLCIPQARVSWVKGRCFGVALEDLKLNEGNRLRFFLWDRE